MAPHTITVSGISDELLRLLDEQIQEQRSTGRSEYVPVPIRPGEPEQRSAHARTIREILVRVHEKTHRSCETEEEMEAFLRS